MISLKKIKNDLLLEYETDSYDWIVNELNKSGEVKLKKGCFIFKKEDLIEADSENGRYIFLLGTLNENDYFKIDGRKLGTAIDVYFHTEINLSLKCFLVYYDISVFKKISKLINESLYVGGKNRNTIPKEEFELLLKNFPNSYELQKYTEARLSVVLENYVSLNSDRKKKYNQYLNKKQSLVGESLKEPFRAVEIAKYKSILEKLKKMLLDQDKYNEHQWQKEIIEIILFLFPKYIYVFENAQVSDQYKNKIRKLDIILVDVNGNIDVIEIKKPFKEKIMTKTRYRDNHLPLRELAGSVMQLEKYIFHLNKSGKKGEEKLTKQYKDKLPKDFHIKVTNPQGLIIMGTEDGLSMEQRDDFEIVKRKYKNLVDIITYDDLIQRVQRIIQSLE